TPRSQARDPLIRGSAECGTWHKDLASRAPSLAEPANHEARSRALLRRRRRGHAAAPRAPAADARALSGWRGEGVLLPATPRDGRESRRREDLQARALEQGLLHLHRF